MTSSVRKMLRVSNREPFDKSMNAPMIWYFIKFFAKESYADQFMAGRLHLNTLGYFKQMESEDSPGRMDSTEAVSMWWQPHDIVMKLSVPKIGLEIEIKKEDLAAPVSTSFIHHNYLHIFCLYAVHSTGFECIDGKFHCEPTEFEELQRQLMIDERCIKFGKIAVITHAVAFLDQLKKVLRRDGYKARMKLMEYYDDEVFHGEIPVKEIPFRKQKRFRYQREFRLCVDTGTNRESAISIDIGDISHICAKVESDRLPGMFELKPDPRQMTP
jgi:hypothetical protein